MSIYNQLTYFIWEHRVFLEKKVVLFFCVWYNTVYARSATNQSCSFIKRGGVFMKKKTIAFVFAVATCLSAGTAGYKYTLPISTVYAASDSKTQVFGDFEYTAYASYIEINDYLGTDTTVEIPSEIDGKKVTTIADNGLSGNSSVEKLIIPEGVTTIGEYALSTNDSLTEIIFPSTLTTIGSYALGYNKAMTEIRFPEGLQNMGECLLYTCGELTEVYIPSTVVSIGENMLASSSYKLESFHVDENNPYYCDVDGILYNKDMTKLVRYPLNRTDSQFAIPQSVTEIANSAFDTVRNLEKLEIPNHVTTIGERAFSMCANLKELKLPQGLTEIPMYCIGSLYNLEKLYIPESVTNIGKVACTFYNTMPTIYYEGTKDDWALITIESGNVDFSELEFVYEYDYSSQEDTFVKGDVNADGALTVADVVALQKWLLAVPDVTLADWKAGDLCEDNKLNVFDLCIMKRMLIAQAAKPLLIVQEARTVINENG